MSHVKPHDIAEESASSQEGPQQKRLAPPLDQSVAQAEAAMIEAALADERKQEWSERQEQHRERMQALNKLTQAIKSVVQISQPREQGTETLHSELKTLRAAVLLAHSVEPKASSPRLQTSDAVQPPPDAVQPPHEPFAFDFGILDSTAIDPFPIPAQSPVEAEPVVTGPKGGAAAQTRPKTIMSAEARARISAAQKLIWAKRRGEKGESR